MLLIAILIFMSLGFSGGLLNVAWTYMQVSFDVDIQMIGILLVCATTGSLIAAFGSGTAVGQWGLGRTTVIATIFAALGLLFIGLSPVWPVLLASIFVMYIGRGALVASMNNYVSEQFDSWAVNLLHASWGLGLTIAPGILTVLLVRYDTSWRAGYVLLAVGFAVLLAVILLHRKDWEAPANPATDRQQPVSRQRAAASLAEPAVRAGMLVFFIYGGVEIGIGQLANTLLVEGRGVSQPIASFWLTMYWGSFTLGRLLVGVIALRVPNERMVWGGLGATVSGAAALALPGNIGVNLAGLVLCGAGLAGFFPILISQTPGRVGRGHSANAIGFQVGTAGLGAALLPGLIGVLTRFFGLEFIAVGLLVNAVLLLGGYLVLATTDAGRWAALHRA